jgi:hypothetical protein
MVSCLGTQAILQQDELTKMKEAWPPQLVSQITCYNVIQFY